MEKKISRNFSIKIKNGSNLYEECGNAVTFSPCSNNYYFNDILCHHVSGDIDITLKAINRCFNSNADYSQLSRRKFIERLIKALDTSDDEFENAKSEVETYAKFYFDEDHRKNWQRSRKQLPKKKIKIDYNTGSYYHVKIKNPY